MLGLGQKINRIAGVKHRWWLMVTVLAVVIIIVVVITLIVSKTPPDPLPESVKSKANFTLYYPTSIPAGFHFDEAAYDPSTHVVTYDYTTSEGDKLYFSLQPKPGNFDFNNFYKKQLSGTIQTSTPLGIANIGVLQKETVSSIVANKTWIIIGAGGNVNIALLEQVSKSLVVAK
jgi:hypothetical protein